MKVSKEKFLSAMSSVDGFEVIKNNRFVLAKWKGQSIAINFNNGQLPEEIKGDDDVNETISYDFAITLLISGGDDFVDVEPLIKYKIANYVNMKSEFSATVIYQEDADIFTIDVRNTSFLTSTGSYDIPITFITMVLSGVVTSQMLREQMKVYINSPDVFLKACTGLK